MTLERPLEYTSAPWIVRRQGWGTFEMGDGLEVTAQCKEEHNGGFCEVVVCLCESDGDLDNETRDNARLISAAPDLLEALVATRAILAMLGKEDLLGGDCLKRVNEAIAKARGEASK